jgi:hypothetical protein
LSGFRWKGLIAFGVSLLGFALAQTPNPTTGAPSGYLDGVFNIIFSSSVYETAQLWNKYISSLISVGLSDIAKALLLIALLYRIYDIWVSEVSSSAFIYTVIRYAFIVGFFLVSNYYLANRISDFPLRGNTSNCGTIIFSQVALCAWDAGYRGGVARLTGLQPRLETAIAKFVTATVSAMAGLAVLKLLRTAVKGAFRFLTPKERTPPPPPTGGLPQEAPAPKQPPSLAETLLRWLNLLPFLAYLLLALPAIIYGFLVIVSSVSTVIAVSFIPLAIALLAWGRVDAVFRAALFILAQVLFIYILPTIFILSVIFALERPAAMMEGISRQIDAAIDNIFTQLTSSTTSFDDQEQQNQQNQGPNQGGPSFFDLQGHAQLLLQKTGEMLLNFGKALVSIAISILMILVLQALAFIFFVASLLISFGAAFALINAVPGLMVDIIQGGGGTIRGPAPGLGTQNLSGPARTRI